MSRVIGNIGYMLTDVKKPSPHCCSDVVHIDVVLTYGRVIGIYVGI